MSIPAPAVQDTKPLYPGEFLRCVVGSTLAGLNVSDSGDRDEMGILLESPRFVTGLDVFEQHTYRTRAEGESSGPGDLDLTVYGLRKFVRLAMAGNPTVIQLLFAPPEYRVHDSPLADDVRAMTPHIVSRRAGSAFLGYLTAQKQRMVGERHGRAKRRELPEGQNFDLKYVSHMVRLGFQGVELMAAGQMTLPLPQPARDYCVAVRRGEVSLDEVMTKTGLLEHELADLRDGSPLPGEPDREVLNQFLHDAYMQDWGET